MTTQLVVVGAGGFGREAIDVLEAVNRASPTPVYSLLGVVDAKPSPLNLARLASRNIPYLGGVSEWVGSEQDADFLIGVGDPQARERIAKAFFKAGHRAAILIHPTSVLGSEVSVGDGSVVCGGVHISTNVVLGNHVHLNARSIVGHDTEVADFVSVNPGAIISGDVRVGTRSLIGAGAVVLQGLDVGEDSRIGASACVVRDVMAGETVKGVPARWGRR